MVGSLRMSWPLLITLEAGSPMRLISRIARRADRSRRSVPRCRGLTFEPLEDRLLLSPLPEQPTSLSLVAGNGVYAGTATLTATLTAGGEPLAGATVAFALNEASGPVDVGSATTDASGVATLPGVALTGFDAALVAGAVEASFAGDATDSATSASGVLMVSPAPATLSLDGLVTTYDGTAHTASLSTAPAGLAWCLGHLHPAESRRGGTDHCRLLHGHRHA